MSSSHQGVRCDSCNKFGFKLCRYKCLICNDYDLCASCFSMNSESEYHLSTHPMQAIILQDDYDTFFNGEAYNAKEFISYTCPLCGQVGLNEVCLCLHVIRNHPKNQNSEFSEVLCPICCSNKLESDLSAHIRSCHKSIFNEKENSTIANEDPKNLYSGLSTPKEHNKIALQGFSNSLYNFSGEFSELDSSLSSEIVMKEFVNRFVLQNKSKISEKNIEEDKPKMLTNFQCENNHKIDDIFSSIKDYASECQLKRTFHKSNLDETQNGDEYPERIKMLDDFRELITAAPDKNNSDLTQTQKNTSSFSPKKIPDSKSLIDLKSNRNQAPLDKDFCRYFSEVLWSSLNGLEINDD